MEKRKGYRAARESWGQPAWIGRSSAAPAGREEGAGPPGEGEKQRRESLVRRDRELRRAAGMLLHPPMVRHELASLLPREELRAVPRAAASRRGEPRRPMELRTPAVGEEGAREGGRLLLGGGGGIEGAGVDSGSRGGMAGGMGGEGKGKETMGPVVETKERNEERWTWDK
jgi:hypothetical protein